MLPLKWFLLIVIVLFFTRCSEGDIITTEIEFEAGLDSCGNNETNNFVFYKVSENQEELLTFGFTSTTFDINVFSEEEIRVALNNQTNNLVYRKLTSAINPETYFCNVIPPLENNIDLELESTNGEGVFQYNIVEDTDTALTFDRTLIMVNTSLNGEGVSLRNEILILGTQRLTQVK